MKFTFKLSLVVLTALAIFYSSCKKSGAKPANDTTTTKPTPTDYKVLGSQIALNFYKSITGAYGGANVNNGIGLPGATTATSRKVRVINSLDAMKSSCGFTLDTTYNTNLTAGDTAKTFSGHFKFIYTCTSTDVDGYSLVDSLTNTEVGSIFNNRFINSQNFTVKALNQTYKLVSMDGGSFLGINNSTLTSGKVTGYHDLDMNYKLSGLQVNFSTGVADLTTGTASFNGTQGDLDSTTATDGNIATYVGTITFLGSYQAKVAFTTPAAGAGTYTINLLTGAVTAD